MTVKNIAATFLISASVAAVGAPAAIITGEEPGWTPLLEADFADVNGEKDTWSFDDAAKVISCTGKPVGVIRSTKDYANFELVVEWMHEKESGNSGVFVWTSKAALDALTKPGLPGEGIEVQVLDPGFKASYEKSSGKPSDWFTCHGDVFPVGKAKMTPYPPLSPNAVRSYPSAEEHQTARRVEPLLHPRHQRRNPALGERHRTLRRQGLPAEQRLPLPRIRRLPDQVPQPPHPRTAINRRSRTPVSNLKFRIS